MPQFRALGPLELTNADGQPIDLGPRRQQVLLAALVVDADRPVPLDELVDRVWDGSPPASVRSAVHTYVTRLRHVLRDTGFPIEHRPAGFVLRADRGRVDVCEFRRLVADPGPGRPASLRAALALWRGVPLTGLPGSWAAAVRADLTRQRVDAALDLARTEIPAGRGAGLAPLLRALADEHPLVEPLTVMLMRALVAAGRPAEAADCFARARAHLADELGVEPSAELQHEHLAVLRAASEPGRSSSTLPPDVPGFAGRAEALRGLDEPDAAITVISGPPGVGKTALALHWAHRSHERFPDGQVFVDLRGFDPSRPPATAEQALQVLLTLFDVPATGRPPAFDALVALYRRTIAGKRTLFILDNACDAEQIRPLLPGAPGSRVLITSRNQMHGLIATHGARPVLIGPLSGGEARDLLAFRLGEQRMTADERAVVRIIASCGRLPLALVVTAARVTLRPGLGLADLADELESSVGRLDAFENDDPVADVRSVFDCSYRGLASEPARLFRALGGHVGPRISVPAVASGAAMPPAVAARLLGELRRGHLVTEAGGNRFACHDLLRAYASELHRDLDPPAERAAVARRFVDHYLQSAYRAAVLIQPMRDPVPLPEADPAVVPEALTSHADALAWFTADQETVLGCVDLAAREDLHARLMALVWALRALLFRTGNVRDLIAVNERALASAARHDDRKGMADAALGLGLVHQRTGELDAAAADYERALRWYAELSEPLSVAHVHSNMARILEGQQRYAEALASAQHALEMYRAAGGPQWEARAMSGVAWYRIAAGQYTESMDECQQALDLLRELGDRDAEAATWDTFGHAHHYLGAHDEAERCYRTALGMHRQDGDRYNEALVLTHLGDNHLARDDTTAARADWESALGVLTELDNPDTAGLHDRLKSLSS